MTDYMFKNKNGQIHHLPFLNVFKDRNEPMSYWSFAALKEDLAGSYFLHKDELILIDDVKIFRPTSWKAELVEPDIEVGFLVDNKTSVWVCDRYEMETYGIVEWPSREPIMYSKSSFLVRKKQK